MKLQFFTGHGMSIAEQTIEKQICAGRYLAESKAVRAKMQRAQRENTNPQAGFDVVKLLEKLCREEAV